MSSSSNTSAELECPAIPTTPQLLPTNEVAIIASGWFWHPQLEYDHSVAGVVRTVVGYTGGVESNPTYRTIKDSTEAILIEFDPEIISYKEVLAEWSKSYSSFRFPSKAQYRSAVWYANDNQRLVAETALDLLKERANGGKLHVGIEPVTEFYKAEEYHQKYVEKQTRR